MDAEHRHELKTNELAEVMTHFPAFFKKHGRQVIGAVLIAAAIISYFVFDKKDQKENSERQIHPCIRAYG
jgi:hypothetical protein